MIKKLFRITGLALLFFSVNTIYAQNIKQAEYFYDADPGVGNGIPISLTIDDTVNFVFNAPTLNLSEGFHTLFVRFKDENNQWGIYKARTFYIKRAFENNEDEQLIAAEYFFDTDPGVGNGTPISLTESDTLNMEFDALALGLDAGFHTLFVRFKDGQNKWGNSKSRNFYIQSIPEVQETLQITAAEYFLGNDPGAGNGIPITLTANDTIDQLLHIALTDVAEGDYFFSIRVKDENGLWSFTSSDSIQISDMAAIASYTYVRDGYRFDFTDNSVNAETWSWDFGDGTRDETNSTTVSHTYDDKGSYEVCLTISNTFFTDSYCDTVIIPNETPTSIALSNQSIEENNTPDALIGELTTTDADDLTHSYTLVAGEGDTDNAFFYIENNQLKTNTVFDYEIKNTYSVRIKTDDGYENGSLEKIFTISITDGNDAPTEINLSNLVIDENQPVGTFIGKLTSVDQDATDVHQYSLIAGTGDVDNVFFEIVNDSLKTAALMDYETNETFSIRVQSDDGNGGVLESVLEITVNDINDAPLGFNLLTPESNGNVSSLIPVLDWENAIDPDGNTVSYELYLGQDNEGIPDVIETINGITESVYEITTALQEDKLYYWKVIASDTYGLSVENNGGWQVFKVNTQNQDPNSFGLITPTNGSVEIDLSPIFYWENNGDPDISDELYYQLYFDTDSLFGNTIPISLNDNSYVPEIELKDNSKYFWKAIAFDKEGAKASVESETFMFWTNTELEPPEPFDLISPVNMQEGISTKPLFEWTKAIDYDPNDYVTYQLIIAKNSTFEDIVQNVENITNNSYQISNSLDDGGVYFWKIIATDTDQLKTSSETFSFLSGSLASPVGENHSICEGENVPVLYAEGENIIWYSDQSLTNIVNEGNYFETGLSEPGSYTFYATQSLSGFESESTTINLIINQIPNAPEVENENACFGEEVPDLIAVGENIQWYSDTDLSQLLFSGNAFSTGNTNTGAYVYYVTQMLNNCRSVPDTVVLTINPLPEAEFTYELNDCEVIFTNNSLYANSYLWDFGDGNTESTENPIYNYTETGNYTITLTAYSEKCGESIDSQNISITTGVNDIDFNDVAKIYPNPSEGVFYFESKLKLEDDLIIHIFDVTGRLILENHKITKSKEKIDLSNYPSGIYFIQLKFDKYIFIDKLVLE